MQIGRLSFARQKDAIAFFRDMLNRYELGQSVSADDLGDLMSLLERHEHKALKIGSGVDRIEVRFDGYKNRCFWIVRTDETVVDFSFVRCVTGKW